MSGVFQITANAVHLPCGCREWHAWEDGAWVHRQYPCSRHEAVR